MKTILGVEVEFTSGAVFGLEMLDPGARHRKVKYPKLKSLRARLPFICWKCSYGWFSLPRVPGQIPKRCPNRHCGSKKIWRIN